MILTNKDVVAVCESELQDMQSDEFVIEYKY